MEITARVFSDTGKGKGATYTTPVDNVVPPGTQVGIGGYPNSSRKSIKEVISKFEAAGKRINAFSGMLSKGGASIEARLDKLVDEFSPAEWEKFKSDLRIRT
jgi:hypothetical protein